MTTLYVYSHTFFFAPLGLTALLRKIGGSSLHPCLEYLPPSLKPWIQPGNTLYKLHSRADEIIIILILSVPIIKCINDSNDLAPNTMSTVAYFYRRGRATKYCLVTNDTMSECVPNKEALYKADFGIVVPLCQNTCPLLCSCGLIVDISRSPCNL